MKTLQFLEEKNIPAFDPFYHNTWHSKFDLNTVEIPFFRIKDKPSANIKTLEEIRKDDCLNLLVKDALGKLDKTSPIKKEIKEKPQNIEKSSNNEKGLESIISKELLKKVNYFFYQD